MVGIENLHRPGLTPACGLRRAKVGFRFPTIPFLYYEYKIRNISIFYSLEFYFSQRAGEGRKSLHRPGLTPAYGLRRAKVVFSAPSIPFCIYHLYKFRELSSFYLQNYFPQRTGEERIDLHRPGLTSAYGLRRAKVVFLVGPQSFAIYNY